MALQSRTITVGADKDVNNGGKNYVSGQVIYIKDGAGVLAPIFRDIGGLDPIAQNTISNVTNAKGQFTFFIEEGNYTAEYNDQSTPLFVFGADYFNNQIDFVTNQILSNTQPYSAGNFTDGFTFTELNQYGNATVNDGGTDYATTFWYIGGTLPHTVAPLTNPRDFPSLYQQRDFNSAEFVATKTTENAQDFIDSFALKIFQSPTDGLTDINTRTLLGGEVYEVRKVSDNSLATIYSDKEGLNPIPQGGVSNVSGSDGVVEFYIADGDYTVTINTVSAGLSVTRLQPFETVADMKSANLQKYNSGTRIEWQGYYEQSDGGSNWGVLKFGAHTEDGGSVFSIDANTYIQANLNGSTSLAKFGATGDGDETLKIQASLNATDRVHGVRGITYLFSTLLIPVSVSVFNGRRAIFKPLGTTNPASIETEAAIKCFGNEGLELNVELDMSNGDMQAVLWDNVKNSQFTKSKIYGFVDNPTFNHRGIRLQNECKNNELHKNYIEGVNAPTQRGVLIDVWGVPAADFGGFFTGTIAFPVSTSSCNNIHHNRLINGSYAVNLQAANENSFHHNYCVNQDHRGIYVANASRDNMIHHNIVKDFLSSGILLGYGSSFNDVSFNRFIRASFSGGGEATINIITGSSDNNIYCNYSDSNNNYGCYVSTDSSRNKVRQNEFKRFYVAGVSVENDFSETRPTNCFYSRPNYGSPTELNPAYQSWTYNDLEGTIIEGNIFGAGDTGRQVACIAISQIQNSDATITGNITAIRGVTIKNNLFTSSDNIAPYLSFYEQLNDRLTNITVTDNDFPVEALTSDFYYFKPSGAQDFNDLKVVKRHGNDRFDDVYNNLSNNVTGSVIDISKYNIDTSDKFITLVNTVATDVTDFTVAKTNTTLTVRLDAFSTIKHDNTKVRLSGGVDVTPQGSNSFITLRRVSGLWIEVSRSF